MSTGFNPDSGSGDGEAVNTTNGETATQTNPLSEAIDGIGEIASIILNNEIILLGLVVVAGLGYMGYKKYDERVDDESYEGKDWSKIIPSDIKYLLQHAGLDSEKDLTRGDFNELGEVFKYDTFSVPKGIEYEDLLFGDIDDEELEDTESKEVYVFMVAPEGDIGKAVWKVTDLYFNMDTSTRLYIVDSDSVEEEHGRFKLDEDIDFKREYGNIMMQKGVETENVTDQFPLYQARKNILEGMEEFSHKTLMLDRQHASEIAQMREDIDEEALQKYLSKGMNF